jgi:DNA-binding beta-propeller fold protein YncE
VSQSESPSTRRRTRGPSTARTALGRWWLLAILALLVMSLARPADAEPGPNPLGDPPSLAGTSNPSRAAGPRAHVRNSRSILPATAESRRSSMLAAASGRRAPVPGSEAVAVDPATGTMYVASETSNSVEVVDARSCNAHRLHCRGPIASIPTGELPFGMTIDSTTRTAYLANLDADTVSVIDLRHCHVRDTSGCSDAPATLPVAGHPISIALNRSTHTGYVGTGANSVAVFDTTACNGHHSGGCVPVASITTGPGPWFPEVDAATSTLYVPHFGIHFDADESGEGMSIVDLRACNATTTSGCGQHPVIAPTGASPLFATVDRTTDTVYVSVNGEGTVALFSRGTCRAGHTTGCSAGPVATALVGPEPQNLALNRRTSSLYVMSDADTVGVIDTRRCNANDTSACDRRVPTLQAGARPFWMDLDRSTDTLYVADRVDNDVAALDVRHCTGRQTSGCRHEAPTVAGGDGGVSMDPARHTLYQSLGEEHALGMIDTAACNVRQRSGCRQDVLKTPLGERPGSMAIDLGTHTLYVVDQALEQVHVINTATCNVSRRDGCAPIRSLPVPAAGLPALNSKTHTVYITQFPLGTVAVIDGSRCNASNQTGCDEPLVSADTGPGPFTLWVDVATNTLYVATHDGDNHPVAVIPGRACDERTPGCRAIAHTAVGVFPIGLASDARTHTLYAANWAFGDEPGSVSIVDTRTCSALSISGCDTVWPRVAAGHGSFGVTFEPSTRTLFTTNNNNASVSVIDVRHCNATDRSHCPATSPTIAVGYGPVVSMADPIRKTLYVSNTFDGTESMIDLRHPCRHHMCMR